MGLCKVISIIAAQVEGQIGELAENHQRMLRVMKNMPVYLDNGDLSSWEADYRKAIGTNENEQSASYKVIDLVYELAGLNLFGAYEVAETERMYQHLVRELQKQGIVIPGNLNVSQW